VPCTSSTYSPRSGWQPPRDYGLWEVAGSLRSKVLSSLSPASRVYWEEEEGYFNKVTSISGVYEEETPTMSPMLHLLLLPQRCGPCYVLGI
jgi:hypothetical protein